MNTRIRLLAEQSQKVAYYEDGGYTPIMCLDQEKFAELIVRECMEVASPNYMSTPEDSVYYVEQAIGRIAEHFGVNT